MEFSEAMKYLEAAGELGIVLGLENIKELLRRLGHPEEGLNIIHIAGTNGKGSTIAYIDSVLIEAGYKTGRFVSPALNTPLESIQIAYLVDGLQRHNNIGEKAFTRYIDIIKDKIEEMIADGSLHPTSFEIETAMAFLYFREAGCDFILLETGMGGRLDSTNGITDKLCSVITSISMDHMSALGNTLSEIAAEKAGIILPHIPVISYEQDKEAENVLISACKEKDAPYYCADFKEIQIMDMNRYSSIFDYKQYKGLVIHMLGKSQIKNAVLAIEVIEYLKDRGNIITEDNVRDGLQKAVWEGRFERINAVPQVIIDGAHNVDAALSLRDSICQYYGDNRKIFIIGVFKDKEYKKILKILGPFADLIIAIAPKNSRALASDVLAAEAGKYCSHVMDGGSVKNAMDLAFESVNDKDVILAFGSLSFLGEMKEYMTTRKVINNG